MKQHVTASAMFTAQSLREKLNRLKERYEHVSSDLKNKAEPKNVQSIRRLEREFLMYDIKRIEKMITDAENIKKSKYRTLFSIKHRLA